MTSAPDELAQGAVTTEATAPRYMVAWAGDKRSKDALKLGEVLARTFGAGLDVAFVVHTESVRTVQHAGERNFQDRVVEQARTSLENAVADLDDSLDVRLHIRRSPSVTHDILDTAQDVGAAAIIIGAGSGGRGAPVSPIVGALLRASPVPVAMAPRGYRKRSFDTLSELACAVGARPGAQQVVEESVSAVERVGLPLHLVSLVDLEGRDRQASKEAKAGAERAIEQAEVDVAGRCEVRTDIGKGKNLKAAVSAIDWQERSALVVGSSRLATGRQAFLGTMATRMLAHLPIPMIVVPAKHDDGGSAAS